MFPPQQAVGHDATMTIRVAQVLGWKGWKAVGIAAATVLFIGVAAAGIWWLPGYFVSSAMQGSPTAPSTKSPTVTEYVNAVTNARQGVLFVVGGLIAIFTLLFTWARHQLDRDANRTTRYTEAIKQLGDESSFAIRLGGIYALERIAQDSDRDRQTILDVLCAFLRDKSRLKKKSGEKFPSMKSDTAAAATVIGRIRKISKPANRMDLHGTNLTGAFLAGANLTGAKLRGAHLFEANLIGANLTGANLIEANLTGAHLTEANLTGAKLIDANLTEAFLTDANLIGAYLADANLTDANLFEANLSGATLIGAYTILSGHIGPAEKILVTRKYLKDRKVVGLATVRGLPVAEDPNTP